MSLNIVILAAGKGTRMKSELPKVLHPLAGRPLVEHVLDTAAALAARMSAAAGDAAAAPSPVVVIGHGADRLRAALAHRACRFALQAEQKGTGHALMQAEPLLDPALPVLVLYGDVPLIGVDTLAALVERARASGGMALLSVRMADPSGYGRIVRAADGRVRAIVEHKDASAAERAIDEVNTGVMLLPAGAAARWLPRLSTANAQGEYYLTDVVELAVDEGLPVEAVLAATELEVQGVNSKLDLAQVERGFQRLQAEALMRAGVTLADPARFDLRGALECGRDVTIDVGCIVEGRVRLGDGVAVGAYCLLKDVDIAAGAQIKPFTHIDGGGEPVAIGAGAQVGPFARLRPGTQLAEEVHIGNFVEVKNSRLAAGAKANHLAYLGDAVVGERVNYGAGSITANYDGANKHRTDIGADVHVGSNCVLVAPVKLGDGATIGAGSVISRDAPAGQLTIARGRQTSFPNWQRPKKRKAEPQP
jgi:bifunctional UDP-N-acetylglucosamine pyrophosphorylase/glucosamine-1-phosphate N-acetyltransferase